jgi:hypothetical protein
MLIERGADANAINENKHTPLHYACKGKKQPFDNMNEYVNNNNNHNNNNNNNIQNKLENDFMECIKILIGVGVNVNAQSVDGNTPLHIVALSAIANDTYMYENSYDCLQLLLTNGADEYIKNEMGNVPSETHDKIREQIEYIQLHKEIILK